MIVERVELLMNDPELREKMGVKGREWIRKNFEIGRMSQNYIDLYEKIIPQGRLKTLQVPN